MEVAGLLKPIKEMQCMAIFMLIFFFPLHFRASVFFLLASLSPEKSTIIFIDENVELIFCNYEDTEKVEKE